MRIQKELNIIEVYLPIVGFEKYEVSNYGNVRNRQTMKILKPYLNKGDYLNVSFNRKNLRVHQLVVQAFLANPENKSCVDHIDNDRSNNELMNLRYATQQENHFNANLSSRNTSGAKGVSYHSSRKKWRARIKINSKEINLGYFDRIEDAIQARKIKANELFGEFCHSSEKN